MLLYFFLSVYTNIFLSLWVWGSMDSLKPGSLVQQNYIPAFIFLSFLVLVSWFITSSSNISSLESSPFKNAKKLALSQQIGLHAIKYFYTVKQKQPTEGKYKLENGKNIFSSLLYFTQCSHGILVTESHYVAQLGILLLFHMRKEITVLSTITPNIF